MVARRSQFFWFLTSGVGIALTLQGCGSDSGSGGGIAGNSGSSEIAGATSAGVGGSSTQSGANALGAASAGGSGGANEVSGSGGIGGVSAGGVSAGGSAGTGGGAPIPPWDTTLRDRATAGMVPLATWYTADTG
ncbi:MAG TPA: hypothetical protein VGM44_06690, partial [Polyangiaceae bacterium]